MRSEFLVERLSRNLRPVRPRSVFREALLLLVIGIVEVAALLGLGFMRPDMPAAMEAPSFWWKLTSMGLIAVLGRASHSCPSIQCALRAQDYAGCSSASSRSWRADGYDSVS